jgi:hypothetical protein
VGGKRDVYGVVKGKCRVAVDGCNRTGTRAGEVYDSYSLEKPRCWFAREFGPAIPSEASPASS